MEAEKLTWRIGLLIMSVLLLVLVIGCRETPVQRIPTREPEKENSQMVMRIGVVPTVSVIKTVERYQPLMSYISKKLNVKAQIVPLKDYSSIINQMESKDLEAGVHGSFSAFMVRKKTGAIPIARVEKDGVSTYESYIFTRKDSGIKSIEDAKGKSFTYISLTSAGYLYPVFVLKQIGYDFETFFSRTSDAVRHDLAVLAVLNGDTDVGAAKDWTYNELARDNPRINKELVVLSVSSAKFPEQAIVVRSDLDSALIQKLKRVLLHMDENTDGKKVLEKLRVDRYIETTTTDWAQLEEMVELSSVSLE